MAAAVPGRQGLRRGRIGMALVLVGAVAAAAACEPTPCDRLPLLTQPAGPAEFPPAPWPVEGTVRPSALADADTDADGVTDTVTIDEAAGTVTVERTAGDLVLAAGAPVTPGLSSYRYGDRLTAGDVDGDGRSDLVVTVHQDATYLVPGATPDGVHAPHEAGVRLVAPPGGSWYYPGGYYPVGDLDGDGADDLALQAADGASDVFRGPAVAAPGPGGTMEPSDGDVIARLTGNPVEVLALSSTVDAVALAAGDAGSVTLATRGGSVEFDTGEPASYLPTVNVALADGPDGEAWLVADVWARYRGVRFIWDTAEPCPS